MALIGGVSVPTASNFTDISALSQKRRRNRRDRPVNHSGHVQNIYGPRLRLMENLGFTKKAIRPATAKRLT